jgi:hypothetical protein
MNAGPAKVAIISVAVVVAVGLLANGAHGGAALAWVAFFTMLGVGLVAGFRAHRPQDGRDQRPARLPPHADRLPAENSAGCRVTLSTDDNFTTAKDLTEELR